MYQQNTISRAAEDIALDVAPPEAAAPASDGQRLIIESRFGTLAVAAQNAVTFPRGLLGFGELHSYALADLDDPRFAQFKVLQSLEDAQLSFLVLPVDPASGLITPADLAAACETLSIAVEDVAILLVITVRKSQDVGVTANLRAPLLIDTAGRTGVQYVLPGNRYPVRYRLSGA